MQNAGKWQWARLNVISFDYSIGYMTRSSGDRMGRQDRTIIWRLLKTRVKNLKRIPERDG